MIHVQHLLGIGHLQRSLQLGESLLTQGFAVTVVSGGMPSRLAVPDGIDLVRLPSLRSRDGSFDTLLDADGCPIDDAWREARRKQLLNIFDRLSPQVLLTETFPFGRRMLRFELLALLEVAHRTPGCKLVVSSIRDILQPKSKPGREAEIVDLVNRYYDLVLVHGDQRVARLEDSFGAAPQIAGKVRYTGYIATQPTERSAVPVVDEVVVSAGGSDTGLMLLQTAIEARPLSSLAGQPWRILVSHAIDEERFAELNSIAADGVTVERNRPDFPSLLRQAKLSISQAGYNTMTDLLSSATPAVVVPYAESEELEQTIRAGRLARLGRVATVNEADLTPPSLARAVDRALLLDTACEIDLQGAAHSAECIARQYVAADGVTR